MSTEKRLESLTAKLLKAEGGARLLSLVVGALVGIPQAKRALAHLSPGERKAALACSEGLQRLRKRARA